MTEPTVTSTEIKTPNIHWDESRITSTYANVCNVLGTREEIALLFGTSANWQQESNEVTVNLSHRIVLNPYAAKRLMTMLEIGIKQYEARYGDLKLMP